IRSTGDYEAGRALVEKYAVKVDPEMHKEVRERYAALDIPPYRGFVNPVYTPVMDGDEIVDVKVDYSEGYADQMLRYSRDYSALK
ncbi:MAG: dihydrofolate reductase, partial [Muribaculaceae bacterium]|nr:dihydrofolate reductase [Muribaculaceae bacterium]